jgi:hypothetical protein
MDTCSSALTPLRTAWYGMVQSFLEYSFWEALWLVRGKARDGISDECINLLHMRV